jgi:sirohydrochlorin ferrochelatase
LFSGDAELQRLSERDDLPRFQVHYLPFGVVYLVLQVIQRALVEAAKLAPRQSHELAVIYEREKQKGNGNRATLAVARKMVAYLLAVDREQRDFIPAEERRTAAA